MRTLTKRLTPTRADATTRSTRTQRTAAPNVRTRPLRDVAERAEARRQDREAGLTDRHRAFLHAMDCDTSALPPEARKTLASFLTQAEGAFQTPEQMTGMRHSQQVQIVEGDAELVLRKEIDLETGRRVLGLRFRHGQHALTAVNESAPMQVRVNPELLPMLNPPASDPDTPDVPTEPTSEEGLKAFFEGALMGDFGENSSISAIAGQTVVGFIPIVGQIADIRDLLAAGDKVLKGESGAWLDVGLAMIGFVPGLDLLKGGGKATKKSSGIVGMGISSNRKVKRTKEFPRKLSRIRKRGRFGRIPKWNGTGEIREKVQKALEEVKADIKAGLRPSFEGRKEYHNTENFPIGNGPFVEYRVPDTGDLLVSPRAGRIENAGRIIHDLSSGVNYYTPGHFGGNQGISSAHKIYELPGKSGGKTLHKAKGPILDILRRLRGGGQRL